MIEIVEEAFDEALEKLGLHGMDALSVRDKVVASVFALEAEVNNGGFDQFYYNGAGDLAYYVPTALKIIGAYKTAEIAEKANSVFGSDGPSRDHIVRAKQLKNLGDRYDDFWGELDDQFYDYPHDLYALLEQYLIKTG